MIGTDENISIESSELLTKTERYIPPHIVEQIEEQTVRFSQDPANVDKEFRYVLLGKGNNVEKAIPVGIPAKNTVLPLPGEIEQKILPLIKEGYQVMADIHNHPPINGRIYVSTGRPESHASSPSTGDITNRFMIDFQKLGIPVPPIRIITYFSGSENKVIWNGFKILKHPEDAGNDQSFEFESSPPETKTVAKFSLKILRRDTDLNELIKQGYIEPIKITTSDRNNLPKTIPNISEGIE